MREIKFRAYIKDENRIIDVKILDFRYKKLKTTLGQSCSEYNYSFNDIELMQYTGLHDKNGKEIYEGDIVKFDYDWTDKNEVGVITWNNQNASFQIKGHIPSSSMKHLNRMICVGNIYENKELLDND